MRRWFLWWEPGKNRVIWDWFSRWWDGMNAPKIKRISLDALKMEWESDFPVAGFQIRLKEGLDLDPARGR